MTIRDSQADNSNLEFINFWNNFRLFPSSLQETLYIRPPFFIGISILPFLIYVVGSMIADVRYHNDWEWTLVSLKEWQEITAVVGVILMILAFNMWRQRIPSTFKWLFENRRIISKKSNLREEYINFLNSYQKELFKKSGRYFFVIIFVLFVIFFNLMAGIPQKVSYNFQIDSIDAKVYAFGLFIVWIFGFSLWGIFLGFAVWPVYTTGKYISKLSEKFDINIQPSHPDNCGGLKTLGDFCFYMALPIIVGGLFFAAFGIGGAILPRFAIGEIAFNEIMPQTIVFSNIVLLVVVLPFIATVFFLPLWNIHCYMVERKKEVYDRYSNMVMELEQKLRSYIKREGKSDDARAAKEKLEILQTIHPGKIGYPVWPFERSILLKLFSPQILGVLGSAVRIFQTLIDNISQ